MCRLDVVALQQRYVRMAAEIHAACAALGLPVSVAAAAGAAAAAGGAPPAPCPHGNGAAGAAGRSNGGGDDDCSAEAAEARARARVVLADVGHELLVATSVGVRRCAAAQAVRHRRPRRARGPGPRLPFAP
jgi:hypothetical protein